MTRRMVVAVLVGLLLVLALVFIPGGAPEPGFPPSTRIGR